MDEGLRRVLVIVAALASAVLLLLVLGGVFMVLMMGAMMGNMMANGTGGGGMMGAGALPVMVVFGLLVIVGTILLMVWALRQGAVRGGPGRAPQDDEALGTLRRRYASGEIGREEYQQKLDDLGAREPRLGSD